jgi:hypothetical protein
MKSELVHFISTNSNIPKVLGIFSKNFLKYFRKIPPRSREPFYEALPYMYRLWYYSTLIEGSTVSPANFINSQVSAKYGSTAMIVPAIKPILSRSTIKGFELNYRVFTCEDHPVLRDLLVFIDHCTPTVQLNEKDTVSEEVTSIIKSNLTFNENYYVTFLTNISLRLNLLRKMPSINTKLAQVLPVPTTNFFKLTKKEQLKKVVEALIIQASETLTREFPYDKKLFTVEKISTMLSNSFNMSEFLQSYFINYGTDMNELIEDLSMILDCEALDEATITSLSHYFTLNSFMDSLLITPIGYYLQLIQPVYTDMYDFNFKMREISSAHTSKQIPIETYYFESCTAFDITSLGKSILPVSKKTKSLQTFSKNTDYNEVYKSIMEWDRNSDLNMFFNMLKSFEGRKQGFK